MGIFNKTEEYILCAAIHYPNEPQPVHKVVNVDGLVVSGYRHHNCISIMSAMTGKRTAELDHIQGFLTSKNRFVDREEAASIAYNAKQTSSNTGRLYSEDLYEIITFTQ